MAGGLIKCRLIDEVLGKHRAWRSISRTGKSLNLKCIPEVLQRKRPAASEKERQKRFEGVNTGSRKCSQAQWEKNKWTLSQNKVFVSTQRVSPTFIFQRIRFCQFTEASLSKLSEPSPVLTLCRRFTLAAVFPCATALKRAVKSEGTSLRSPAPPPNSKFCDTL